ncbi:MAG: S-layer homology domain-containing protein [Oscillospiraceae bacterium]|nr:S-layer homology domain-containing protein [Oscillospiraceae bacterium]
MKNKKILKKFISLFVIAAMALIFIPVLFVNAEVKNNNDAFYVHIIDIGEGDAILIQSPDNEFALIDTGNYKIHKRLYEYFDDMNITKFKYLILTHHHPDHVDIAPPIISDYPVETLMMSYGVLSINYFSAFATKLIERAAEKNVEVIYPDVGYEFTFGDAKFLVLGPNSGEYRDPNDFSLVIKMTYKNNTVMFTGDMTEVSENEVIEYADKNNIDLKCDVLKVAHHGDNTSTSEAWLAKVNPGYAVISTGTENVEGHPGESTIKRLEASKAKIYRTDEHGSIIVKLTGSDIEILDKMPSNEPVEPVEPELPEIISVSVIPSSWAEEEVYAAIKTDLVPEELQKNYQKYITRIETAQMFINLIEKISGQSVDGFMKIKGVTINASVFTDTSDKAVLAANALGIVNGVGNKKFAPDDFLTRAQAAAIINRTAHLLEINTDGYSHIFVDVSGHWVDAELGWLAQTEIIRGMGENIFDPDGNLTREQAIAIIYRAFASLSQ